MQPATRRALQSLWRRHGSSASVSAQLEPTRYRGESLTEEEVLRASAPEALGGTPPEPSQRAPLDATQLLSHAAPLPVGPVFVGYSLEGVEQALARCFPPCSAPSFLGFDTEQTPTFVRDQPQRRTALVQAASEEHTVLAHCYHLPSFPPRLAALVEDPRVTKVGVAVGNDLSKLARDYGVRPRSYLNLEVVATLYGHARPGLKALSEAFGCQVLKPKSLQTSDWERAPLRPLQRDYAALDAQLGLWLLHRLHAAHAPAGCSLEDWAEPFRDAPSVAALAVQPTARLGPLADAVALYMERKRQEAAAREAQASLERALKLDSRSLALIHAGLADEASSTSALTDVATARGVRLTWEEHAAEGLFRAEVLLDGKLTGCASARSKRLARRDAAVEALRELARSAV